ncbi:MAG: translocation/assembly module TamB domain-containing protein, partial [Candidatus Marinimicrobia bacterium]|nr:translocation/assembly module TamB domain-containing protein [Candidatus Neomarinimicrobiota bacterium]
LKGEGLIQSFKPAQYLSFFKAYPNDVLDMFMDFSGNKEHFRGNFSIQGILAHDVLRQFDGALHLFSDSVEINHVTVKNTYLDAIIKNCTYHHGNIALDASLQKLSFPDTIPFLNEVGISGDLLAVGHFPDSLMISYFWEGTYKQDLSITEIDGTVLYKDQNIIFCDTTFLRIPGMVFELQGHIDSLSTLDIQFEMFADHFQTFLAQNDEIGINEAKIQGRIKGLLSNPDLSTIYLIDEAYRKSHHLSRARGAASIKHIKSHPSGNLFVDFSGLTITPYAFQEGSVFLEFENDTIFVSSLSLESNENEMELVGLLTLDSLVMVQEFAANIQGENLYLNAPFHVNFRSDEKRVSPLILRFNNGLFEAEASWNTEHQFFAHVKGTSLDLSDLLSLGSYNVPADGQTDFTLDVYGNYKNPILHFGGNIQDFVYDDYSFKNISVTAIYRDSLLLVEKGDIIQNPEKSLNFMGRFPMNIGIRKGVDSHFSQTSPFVFEVDFQQFPLDVVSSFLKDNSPIKGSVEGIFQAQGYYHDPVMKTNLMFQNVEINGFYFEQVLSQMQYKDKSVSIRNLNFKNPSGDYSIMGSFPVDLRLQPVSQRINESDTLLIYFNGSDKKLSYLTPFLSFLNEAEGNFITQLTLTGSPLKPTINGFVHVKESTLIFQGLLNPIQNVQGILTAQNNILEVNLKGNMEKHDSRLFSFSQDISKNRNVTLTGTLDLEDFVKPQLDLRLRGNNIYIRTLNDRINLVGDGDITLKGRDTLRAEGIYSAKEGVLNFDFKKAVLKPSIDENKTIFEYILELPVNGNVFLRNELVDIELEGEVVLEKRGYNSQIMSGSLSVRSGKFYYYSAIFDIESGEITFDPYANQISLNFQAITPVLDGSNHVIATVSGDIDKLSIELFDEKNMFTTQAEIIQLLTTGTVDNNQLITGAAQNYLETIFEKELERTASEWGGFERVDLKSQGSLFESPNLDSLTILLERRVGKNLYVSYEQALNNDNANRNIELEYRLNRNISIIGKADDESVSFSYRIRFQY